jgi:hypothetical protein
MLKDKKAHASYMRAYYAKNKAAYLENKRNRAAKHRRALSELKAARGCRDCGESDPRVLQFHHRDPSEKTFTIGASCGRVGLKTLFAETEKCDVLCANCHIKEHNTEEDAPGV